MQQAPKVLVDYIRTSVEILLNMRLDRGQAQSLARQVQEKPDRETPQSFGQMLIKGGLLPPGLESSRKQYSNLMGVCGTEASEQNETPQT